MNNHDFSNGIQVDPMTGEEYWKCQRCYKVMFAKGDESFNIICQVAIENRENIRKRLEAK